MDEVFFAAPVETILAALVPTIGFVVACDQDNSPIGPARTGDSFFRVLIVSEALAGKSRIDRHRMVNEVLKSDVGVAVHALALSAYAPGEKVG